MKRNKIIQEDVEQIASADLPWRDFSGRSVLVSGAGGFLPAYMIETLAFLNERGMEPPVRIIGLARHAAGAWARLGHLKGRPDFTVIEQDVCTSVPANVQADFVIHAASQASPKQYGRDPLGTFRANTVGTENMLELAHRGEALAMLYFSSSEVYGRGEGDGPLTENSFGPLEPCDVRSCYAEGKRAGETLCACWNQQHDTPVKIVRPFHTYGPGMRLDDGRVFADFVAAAVQGRNITLTSDGSARRAFCYLADATEAFFAVLLKGQSAWPYNVGNPDGERSILQLAQTVVNLVPEKNLTVEIKPQARPEGYIPSKVARNLPDISRVSALGWTPRTTVEQGFLRTIRSFA